MAPTAARRARPAQRNHFQGLQGNPDACRPRRGSAYSVIARKTGGNAGPVLTGQLQPTAAMNPRIGGGQGGRSPPALLSPHFFGKKWGRPPRRRVPRGEPPVIERRVKNAAPYRRPPCMAALRIDSGQLLYPARRAARRVVAPHEEGDPQCPAGDHRSPLRMVKSYAGRSRADDIRPYRPGN